MDDLNPALIAAWPHAGDILIIFTSGKQKGKIGLFNLILHVAFDAENLPFARCSDYNYRAIPM